MIRITAQQEGFRRCGIAHTVAAVEYKDNQFTEEQLTYLKAEPKLVVEIIKDAPLRPNANDTIVLVKGAADIAALDLLATGEERKSVLTAIASRRAELEPAE